MQTGAKGSRYGLSCHYGKAGGLTTSLSQAWGSGPASPWSTAQGRPGATRRAKHRLRARLGLAQVPQVPQAQTLAPLSIFPTETSSEHCQPLAGISDDWLSGGGCLEPGCRN